MTPEEKNIELEKRISSLEGQIAFLKHALECKDIVKPTPYPPYIPWTTPTPVESMFTPSQWQCVRPH
jgi:hypothetical protein